MASVLSLNRVSPESFKITNQDSIGEGTFGIVYKGTWKEQTVAIKKLRVQKGIPHRELESFENEASIMQACESERIIKLFGVCMVERNYALILEYMEGGSLFSLLQKDMLISWEQRWSIAEDIGAGLAYLHSKNIIHGDLKSHNVLLDQDFRAKLCDFGQAKVKVYTSTTTNVKKSVGTARWRAPEQIPPNAQRPAKPSDVYSFGVVLWEIASRKVPYSNTGNDEVGYHIKGQETETRPESCPDVYWAVIKERCWKYKLEERSSIDAILEELRKQVPIPEDEEARIDKLYAIGKNGEASSLAEQVGASCYLDDDIEKAMRVYRRVLEKANDVILKARVKAQLQQWELNDMLKAQVQGLQTQKVKEVAALKSVAKEEAGFREDKVRDLIGPNFFGRAEWTKYIGEVENVPPLPADIEKILQSPCPYFPGKKIGESHLLTLIPEQVRDQWLTLRTFEVMIKTPKEGGHAIGYRDFWDKLFEEFGDRHLERAQWMLLSRDVIPGSRGKAYSDQQALLYRGSGDFEVPHLLEAIVAIAGHYIATGERLYADKPKTYTRCQERTQHGGYLCFTGNFDSSGLVLKANSGYKPDDNYGVGSARKC